MTISPDLVPSVTSRMVTINAVELNETVPKRGHVDFELPRDLHVAVDGAIITASSIRARLVDGRAQVPLPTVDADADPGDGLVLVRKSWAPEAYAVQVPAGTSPISLAALRPVDTAPVGSPRVWALTGAGVKVRYTASDQATGGTVTIAGGVATFNLDIPRGMPGGLGSIEQQADGLYRILDDSLPMTRDQLAVANGFYLLPGPPTSETTRNGLPIYWMGDA